MSVPHGFGVQSLVFWCANQRQKFIPRLLVVPEAAKHGTGHSLAVLLFDAAHLHTEVARFDNYADTLGADFFLDGLGDLAGEALLNLEAAGKHIDEARDFAKADDALIRQIGYVALAEERQKMVLAEAEEFNVLDDYHFVVSNAEGRAIENIFRVLVVAAGQEFQRLFVTFRSLAQAFAIWIFAD